MPITMSEITPVGLCIATEDLFDTKRYRQNFCDNILLRVKDKGLDQYIIPLKKDLNNPVTQKKFLEGHKAVIISNIDKIIAHAAARYAQLDYKEVESIVTEGKVLIKKILFAESFDQLGSLAPTFKSKISLKVYSLFLESMKRSRMS